MTTCSTMDSLKCEEKKARSMIDPNTDPHMQTFYAQVALDAKRMQAIHAELCQACMDAEVKA